MLTNARLALDQARKYISSHDLAMAIVVTIGYIIIGTTAVIVGSHHFSPYPNPHYLYQGSPGNPFNHLANWDGVDYISIARRGYRGLFQANFFPLYPLLIKAVSYVSGSLLLSALVISWLSLVVAIYFWFKIIRYLWPAINRTHQLVSVLWLLFFPSGIFLMAAYSEGLYAALALAAVYGALKRRWLVSGLCLAFLGALHVTFPAVWLLVVLILYLKKVKLWQLAVSGLIGLVGLASFMAFLWAKFNDPLAFVHAQQKLHGWTHHSYSRLLLSTNPLQLILVVLIILAAIYWWRRFKPFSLYCLSYLAIPLAGKEWGGFNRYCLMLFPIILMVGFQARSKPKLGWALLGLSIIGWLFTTSLFAAGYVGS